MTPDAPDGDRRYAQEVERKADRMARARRQRQSAWRHLAHVGVLGWLFVLPVVGGALVGHFVGKTWGIRYAAILGLLVGLIAGALTAWRHITRSMEGEE